MLGNKKTFYVQKYNKEGEPIPDTFEQYTMATDDQFSKFLARVDAKGLELIVSCPLLGATKVDL